MTGYEFDRIKHLVKFKQVDHYDEDNRKYAVFLQGNLIGHVESWTRTSSDIPNSNFRRDIKGVKQWSGHRKDGFNTGMHHTSRASAVAAMIPEGAVAV